MKFLKKFLGLARRPCSWLISIDSRRRLADLIGNVVDGQSIGGQVGIVEEFDDGHDGRTETRREQDLSHVERLGGASLLLGHFIVCIIDDVIIIINQPRQFY